MKYEGDASAPDMGFLHSALIYGSDRGFMDVALPFAKQAIAAGEPVLVAVQKANVEQLRSALGGEPEGLALHSAEEWHETSAGTRDKIARWAKEHGGRRRVRAISEPPWALGNEAQVRDWARHESVINVAFDGMGVDFVCAYDARVLPGEIVEHAVHTHPELAHPEGHLGNADYVEPKEFCRQLDSSVERPDGEPDSVLDFGLADLRHVRRLVTSVAVAIGMPGARADELALAVNEIASNAVVHGSPPATLRVWARNGELICEVSDAGEGIKQALAGQLTPPSSGVGGRGIWLARMLCDAVEIRNGTGCTVSVHALVPGASARRLDRSQQSGVDLAEGGRAAERHRQVELGQQRAQDGLDTLLPVER
jgi:anti-sigma regulatory factor (Ser/Thr protein kinase)